MKINLKMRVRTTKKKIVVGTSQEKNNMEISIHEYKRTAYSDRKINAK
jgi:hypothetical protein